MATKDNFLFVKNQQQSFSSGSNGTQQYSNLNLNQNRKCSNILPLQQSGIIKSGNNFNKFNNSGPIDDGRGKSNQWKKDDKKNLALGLLSLESDDDDEEDSQKPWKKKNSKAGDSYFSEHMAAYKSPEDDGPYNEKYSSNLKEKPNLTSKWKTAKQLLADSKSTAFQSSFEFPRQQENCKNEPEIMQFKASQKLHNPNQSPSAAAPTVVCSSFAASSINPAADAISSSVVPASFASSSPVSSIIASPSDTASSHPAPTYTDPSNAPATGPSDIQRYDADMFQLFKFHQNDKDSFDVSFIIEEKILRAHASILSEASQILKLKIERQRGPNRPIKIPACLFNDFYQLLYYIYTGYCSLTVSNVIRIANAAATFKVPGLTDCCDEFLSKVEVLLNLESVESLAKDAEKCSLKQFAAIIRKFVTLNFIEIVKSAYFGNFSKQFVGFLISCERPIDAKLVEENLLLAVLKWATKQAAIHERNLLKNAEFDVKYFIKEVLKSLIDNIRFCDINVIFIIKLIAEYDFLFSPHQWISILAGSRRHGCEEHFFTAIFRLAAKEVQELQEITSFDFGHTVKDELSAVLPAVNFNEMSETYLYDFVVRNGILTPEQAKQVYNVTIYIRNGDQLLSGSFKDEWNIYGKLQGDQFGRTKAKQNSKIRMWRIICKIPSTSSSVHMVKGVTWYLCLEADGKLCVKRNVSIDKKNDYLIAELRSQGEFRIDGNKTSVISATIYKPF